MTRKYHGDVTEMDLSYWKLDAATCQAVNSETFLKSTSCNDGRLMHILNRNSRFCIKVPDKFLAHNCTPAWRLQHSCKMFQPTIHRNYARPKSANLRKRLKYTSGIKAPEPDPVSFSMGLLHHGMVSEAEAEGFDPVCHSSNALSTCPNPERHKSLLESCPLPLACPSCWSAQRRESAKNAYGEFYKGLQRKLIGKGNTGSYMEYRVLHSYGKIWRKSINAGTAEFRKLVKGLEAKEREKLEKRKMDRKKVSRVIDCAMRPQAGQSHEQVVKIEREEQSEQNVDVCIEDQEDKTDTAKSFRTAFEGQVQRCMAKKRKSSATVIEIAKYRKLMSS